MRNSGYIMILSIAAVTYYAARAFNSLNEAATHLLGGVLALAFCAAIEQLGLRDLPSTTFPVIWEFCGFLVYSRKARETIYEPAFQDLMNDYYRSKKFDHPFCQFLLTLIFTFRTLLLVGDCYRVEILRLLAVAAWFWVPESVKQKMMEWWFSK